MTPLLASRIVGHGRAFDEVLPDDVVTAELAGVLTWLGELARAEDGVIDAARIDRIALLEKIRAAATGAQAEEIVKFAVSQVQAQEHADVDPRKVGRGIADQVALACKVSPSEGSRRLGFARALHFDLPATRELLTSGEVSDYVAQLVVNETRHLDANSRRSVDADLVASGLASMSPRSAAASARRLAYQADPQGFVERGRTERRHRRVGLRPAPDTMSVLSAYLPVEQGVAAWAALKRHTDTVSAGGDPRTRDQIMADTLVERLTGQQTAADVNIEVGLLMPVDALLDPDSPSSAELPGFGPLPAPLARQIIDTTQGRRYWRRLFTAPRTGADTGPLVGGDPQRRRFDGWLAQLITLRDQHCRDPYCEAPIRHIDHITRYSEGGRTTLTNGRGVCARGNYVREMPGWQVKLRDAGLDGSAHAVAVTTPTGHTYTSHAPQPP